MAERCLGVVVHCLVATKTSLQGWIPIGAAEIPALNAANESNHRVPSRMSSREISGRSLEVVRYVQLHQ